MLGLMSTFFSLQLKRNIVKKTNNDFLKLKLIFI